MRDLYTRLGAMDAELMIVDAFLREQARHDKILQQKQDKDSRARRPRSTDPSVAHTLDGVVV